MATARRSNRETIKLFNFSFAAFSSLFLFFTDSSFLFFLNSSFCISNCKYTNSKQHDDIVRATA